MSEPLTSVTLAFVASSSYAFAKFTTEEELLVDAWGGGWSPYDLVFMSGLTNSGERHAVVISERPQRLVDRLDQAALELLNVQQFRSDYHRFAGTDPFLRLEPVVDDPPDFQATSASTGKIVALECTSFTGPDRRARYHRFDAVRQALLGVQKPRTTYGHLLNRMVVLGLPDLPRSSDDGGVTEIVEALKDLRPDPGHDDVTRPVPKERRGWPVELGSGVTVDLPRLQAGYQQSDFQQLLGFDLALAHDFTLKSSAVRSDFEQLVLSKDVPANDWLLVSSGAPSASGLSLPADDLLGRLAIETSPDLTGLSHLKRVIVHRWFSGEAWEVFPNRRCLFRRSSTRTDTPWWHRKPRQVGRNESCPCGSTLKFKRCHGA